VRVIGYEWRLREVMAAQGMFSTTKLAPLLAERGIHLSTSQVYRLAAEKPERLNMHVLVALMDIFDCTADDLISRVQLGLAATTGTDDQPVRDRSSAVLRERGLRPRRAEILPRSDA
jgi:hypothetical protein